MHPYLIELGSFKLPTYGFMIAAAYLSAIWYIMRQAKKNDFEKETVSDLIFYSAFFGIIGGKLFYILTFWNNYGNTSGEKMRNIFTLDGLRLGFVFYGGFLCALTAAIIFCRMRKISFLKIADLFSPALALAHAIGRLGCFSAGCCHGHPTNSFSGVVFSDPYSQVKTEYLNIPIHPTQLYESFGNLLIFFLLKHLYDSKRPGRDGAVFAVYLALYSTLRFAVEFFRGDSRGAFLLGLSQAQLISVFNLVFLASAFLYLRRRGDKG